MGNTFGHVFRVTTFGESHGPFVGAVIDGCPARLPIAELEIQRQMDRRRPGQSTLTTPRNEPDRIRIVSGVQDGVTLGSPVALQIANQDTKPGDYRKHDGAPRPSHADLTYRLKYGVGALSGGGRSSARETAARVAAGAVAEKLLATRWGTRIVAWVSAVGDIVAPAPDLTAVDRDAVDATPVRCPDAVTARRMIERIEAVKADNDSIGGTVTCLCRGVPPGWGEPVFDKLHAVLAHAMVSIPAVKGFEIGSGFEGTRMRGSQHNDAFVMRADGKIGTRTNYSGGIQGGISNGEPIVFRVAFKPVSTIGKPQDTVTYDGQPTVLPAYGGRHDPCVLPRAVPVVESMAALVLADMGLQAETNRW